jgi:hypothetical protein
MSLHKRDLQDEILHRTGYTPCPNELFEALKGEPTAFMVWMYIFKQSETWNPSYTRISIDLNISRNSVIRAVKILEDLKILIVHSGGQFNGVNETNKYELSPIAQWTIAPNTTQESPNPFCGGVVQKMHQGDQPFLGGRGAKNAPGGGALEVLELRQKETKTEEQTVEKKVEEKKTNPEATYSLTEATKATVAMKKANESVTIPQEKPTVREILRSWKRVLPDRPSFDARLSLLEDLFATLKKFSYKEDDLPRTFKEEALSSWVNSKSKEYIIKFSNEDYDKALSILSPEIQIVSATPVKQKMKIRNSSSNTGEMDIDTALQMVTDDDEIERIVAAHQKLLKGEDNE